MLIAWLKLRQRSLGPLLDASGWAINGRMRINTRLGGSLSQTAKVPATARRTFNDPFAESKAPLWWIVGTLVVLLVLAITVWRLQWLDRWMAPTPPAAGPVATTAQTADAIPVAPPAAAPD